MNDGWVKLNRKLNGWRYKTKPSYVALFVHLLTNANTKDAMVYDVEVKRGCLLTSYEKLASETGLTVQQVRTILKHLNGEELTYKSTNRFTLISIVKFDQYQGSGRSINKQINKQITNDQQTTNNKQEYKEYKNIKKSISRGGMGEITYTPTKHLSIDELDELLSLRSKYDS